MTAPAHLITVLTERAALASERRRRALDAHLQDPMNPQLYRNLHQAARAEARALRKLEAIKTVFIKMYSDPNTMP